MVFELLSNKIDDLLESLVFINFIPTTSGPGSNASTTHESIDEIIDFLKITFMWLTHLPHSARDAAHFTSCSKVSPLHCMSSDLLQDYSLDHILPYYSKSLNQHAAI